jgi:Peptidase family M28
VSTDWASLIEPLASGPRENGTAQLEHALLFIETQLKASGLAVTSFEYSGHPYRLRIAGLLALVGGSSFAWLLHKKKTPWALLILVITAGSLVLDFDYGLSLFSSVGAVQERHVLALVPSAQPVQSRLIFSSHVDTKTDLFDHVQRAPLDVATPILLLFMFLGCALKVLRKAAMLSGLTLGLGLFLTLSAGAFLNQRSHGAIDSGAGCMVLLELAQTIGRSPLQHTEVQFVFFSGEEVGIEGSEAWLRSAPLPLKTRVLNLDGVGASASLAFLRAERYTARGYLPDETLVEALSAAHEKINHHPIHRTWYPASTDARAFLSHRIPAVTVASDLPEHEIQRGLHSSQDQSSRISAAALEATTEILLETARQLDAAQ